MAFLKNQKIFSYSTLLYIVPAIIFVQHLIVTSMKVENTQVQMRKGIIEFCILEIISRGEVYASDMLDELTAAKMIVVEGTLYPLLTRLKNAGLLDYTWVESSAGPPRKYYKLTATGQEFLEQLRQTWKEVEASIEYITKNNKAS
jgi:PadR family transcriptional regulator, regulatory protein PadR